MRFGIFAEAEGSARRPRRAKQKHGEDAVRYPSLMNGWRASLRAGKAEGLAHTSVGQRPTYRQCNVIKAEGLAHYAARRDAVALPCARLTALMVLVTRVVGRCPTLVCVRPLVFYTKAP